MMTITRITSIDDKKHIALLDTSSISFMQGLEEKGIPANNILKDYDLVLIPEWVLAEINDAEGRTNYLQKLIVLGYPIHSIAEEDYSNLTNSEEGNLYQIVLASTYQLGRIKSYLRRFVEKADVLDMDAYKDWINKLYDEWPIPGQMLSSGRIKKKNAGEVLSQFWQKRSLPPHFSQIRLLRNTVMGISAFAFLDDLFSFYHPS